MLFFLLYLFSILILFVFLILLIIYYFYSLIADFKGAPFVSTSGRYVREILAAADLKKGHVFLELGSGDGRMVRQAVKRYGVVGVGVEIHPLLVWYSRLMAKLQGLENIKFIKGDLFKVNLIKVYPEQTRKTDVLFFFLMPKSVEKLKDKLLTECKRETLIISHGFKIKGLERFLIKTQSRKLFSTYFYKLSFFL